MRKTSRSSNDRAISSLRALASARSAPKGFSTTSVVCGGQARPGQRLQRGAEQHVRQRQVHRHRGGRAVECTVQLVGRGDVGLSVRQALEQRVGRLVVTVGEVGVELVAGVGAVVVVVTGVAVDREDLDVVGQVTAPRQPHQGG